MLVLSIANLPDDPSSLQCQLSTDDSDKIEQLMKRRVDERQPLAYLLGECRYMGLQFTLRPGVVVPRSPLGYLLQDNLPWLPSTPRHILDLCAGSGCLGIVAALCYPQAQVTLVESSDVAVAVAQDNIRRHQLQTRVEVVQADLNEAWLWAQQYDLVITNPPYVNHADMAHLPAEFLAEPPDGLASGEDGLDLMHVILKNTPAHLSDRGVLLGEVGASAPALLAHYPQLPFIWPELPLGGEGVFVLEAQGLHTAAGVN